MERVVTGPAADWLAARRDELNVRFARAQHRVPALSAERVLSVLAEVLPPLAGPEPGSAEVLSAVFDLVLLHVGRDTFATRPALDRLVRVVFPKIRGLLLERPALLPGALSNAVENVGSRGEAFVDAIAQVLAVIPSSDLALDAVAVTAWRLGDARLRESALEVAARLPGTLSLRALDLLDFPEQSAPVVLAALGAAGWMHPRALWSTQTLEALAAGRTSSDALLQRLREEPARPLQEWKLLAKIGDFSGFGGDFDNPPLVLDGGGAHHVYCRVQKQDFRIDADVFGWTCTPQPTQDLAVRATSAPTGLRKWIGRLAASSDKTKLLPDGTVTLSGQTAKLSALAGSTSYAITDAVVMAAHADSHRVRVVGAKREAL
jgi:hypothetical protein